eukprot:6051428-Pleurochrysis_carterae.AAC.2
MASVSRCALARTEIHHCNGHHVCSTLRRPIQKSCECPYIDVRSVDHSQHLNISALGPYRAARGGTSRKRQRYIFNQVPESRDSTCESRTGLKRVRASDSGQAQPNAHRATATATAAADPAAAPAPATYRPSAATTAAASILRCLRC